MRDMTVARFVSAANEVTIGEFWREHAKGELRTSLGVQLPVIGDDHPAISQLTASLWFRSMEVKITNSTSKSRGPSNERRNVAETEKQLESMKYRLTQENGWWPFLTPRLENATNKTREEAPPLLKQVWSFWRNNWNWPK